MYRPNLYWIGLVSVTVFAIGCAGRAPSSTTPSLTPPLASDSGAGALQDTIAPTPVEVQPVLIPDSTGTEPRPWVMVEKQTIHSVRTRLIPRVMGKGWTLSVNKSDSIEFLRNADPELTAMLFHCPPLPASRIRLRFRLESVKAGSTSAVQGVKITSTAHMVGMTVYPYRPAAKILEDNLAELRNDLMSGPSILDPLDKTPPKRQKK